MLASIHCSSHRHFCAGGDVIESRRVHVAILKEKRQNGLQHQPPPLSFSVKVFENQRDTKPDRQRDSCFREQEVRSSNLRAPTMFSTAYGQSTSS